MAELAGDYIYGNGFVYEHLDVSKTGQYHYRWNNDVISDEPHDRDRYESRGRCSMVDGVLRLVPEGPFSSELRRMMGNDFVPVRWGDRRYLIPEKERLVFCSAVNRDVVPRYMRSGPFSVPDGHRRKPPEGRPGVPPESAPYLLEKPVAGMITDLLPNHVAILSVGANDRLRPGMEFIRDKLLLYPRIRVLYCDSDHCLVRMSTRDLAVLPESSPRPFEAVLYRAEPFVIGEKLSSRAVEPEDDL